jgi:quinoprotein glucose dehydrogenase
MGYLFLFDRETGRIVIWRERSSLLIPVSSMPGEKPWPTQPMPVNRHLRARVPGKVLWPSSAWIKEEITKNNYKTGVYEPPSMEGSIMLPNSAWRIQLGWRCMNPETNRLFVNSTDIPMILKLTDLKKNPGGQPAQS